MLDDLVLRSCAGCRGPRGPWCPQCAGSLAGPVGRALLHPHPPGLPEVRAVAAYDGPLREALVAFKDHGRWLLRRPLGRALARAVAAGLADRADPPGRVLLVPVPGSPGSARLRDGDHVGELARVAARSLEATTGMPTRVVSALAPARRRHDQVGLDRWSRAANLSGAMVALPSRLPAAARLGRAGGEVLVVVDDLTTTGATLAESVRALRRAGAGEVLAAVVAAREVAVVARST